MSRDIKERKRVRGGGGGGKGREEKWKTSTSLKTNKKLPILPTVLLFSTKEGCTGDPGGVSCKVPSEAARVI